MEDNRTSDYSAFRSVPWRKVPDQQIVTFPYRCSATEEQVRILKAGTADLLDKSIDKDLKRNEETFRYLGLGFSTNFYQ